MKSKVTMDDIAKKCGVSRMTVSNALSNKTNQVSLNLQKQIKKCAFELGYIKNIGIIRIVIWNNKKYSSKELSFFSHAIEYIADEFNKYNYLVKITEMDVEYWRQTKRYVNDFNYNTALIILGMYLNEEDLKAFSELKIPFLVVGTYNAKYLYNYINLDEASITERMCEIIKNKNIKDVNFISCKIKDNNTIKQREICFDSVLDEQKDDFNTINKIMIKLKNNFNVSNKKEIINKIKKIYNNKNKEQAFICSNDYLAIIISDLLEDLNYEGVVFCYDGIEGTDNKKIYTRDIKNFNSSKIIVTRMLHLIENPKQTPLSIIISTKLKMKDS